MRRNAPYRGREWPHLILPLLAILWAPMTANAASLTASAAVKRQDVFEGESFLFQIQISGSEKPEQPDLSRLKHFSVQQLGGQQNSSRSVSIVNGRMSQTVTYGYVFNYHLTPHRTGTFSIPAIQVKAEGQIAQTQPIAIRVQQPMETEDFKFRMHLPKETCYVGEPIPLTLTWYFGRDIRSFNISAPALNEEQFFIEDGSMKGANQTSLVRVPINGGETTGKKGQGSLDGSEFTTVEVQKVLIPKKAGTVRLAKAVAECEVLTGYKNSSDPFRSFFNDSFFGRRQGVYEKTVVPSNELTLQVLDLPQAGRPTHFSGHIGVYHIEASATPTSVNVGDPITLSMTLQGSEYMEHLELPPLNKQAALTRDFKIPADRAEGKTIGKRKVFTQTIRALRADVKEIPPIELSYFDTETKRYRTATSKPIPLSVHASRVVTAADAEGLVSGAPAAKLEAWTQGIAHNYEGEDVLRDQRYGPIIWLRSPIWMTTLSIPPVLYFGLVFVVISHRRRHADPDALRARMAYRECLDILEKAQTDGGGPTHEVILQTIQSYLGAKLRIPGGALTYKDIEKKLAQRNVDAKELEKLQAIFHQCEAGRFAGQAGTTDRKELLQQCRRWIKTQEQHLR